MILSVEKLRELLVQPGHIAESEFALFLAMAKEKQLPLEQILIDQNAIQDEQLGQLIAESLGYNFINLRNEKINEKFLKQVPELVARNRGVIAFGEQKEKVLIGMTDPEDMEIRQALEKRFGRPISPRYITNNDLALALLKYKTNIKDEADELIGSISGENKKNESESGIQKLLDLIINHGVNNKASDVHLEPHDESLVIRYRIDGVMHIALKLDKEYLDPLISRIKILAKLRTDEHRSAQDGKFRHHSVNEDLDIRVSIVPITGGENVVLRLLSIRIHNLSLNTLGFSLPDLAKIRKAMMHPHGMLLVTGPTGSGKTTTIYEILKILNTEQVHIATIEDPVEYAIEGVSQIQVNQRTNLTFAQGLRAIVRQDPDIIMVGEIRDNETAEIAINSAMTGHLVLSSMHTNDSPTAILRLLDMGIEPYLVSSTLNLVIAQRLIRLICERCRYSYPAAEEKELAERLPGLREYIVEASGKEFEKVTFYKGAGCNNCANTGYKNRMGIYEVLEINQNIKDLIMVKSSGEELMASAKKDKMTTMLEDGINKILSGSTTLSEVLRVAMN
jgi:type IV pilus assembly protein PilB